MDRSLTAALASVLDRAESHALPIAGISGVAWGFFMLVPVHPPLMEGYVVTKDRRELDKSAHQAQAVPRQRAPCCLTGHQPNIEGD